MTQDDGWEWILAPLIGVAGLLGAYIFSQQNNVVRNDLPPPPPPPKKGGCGCQGG